MGFNWNISTWIKSMLPAYWRKPIRQAWLEALLAPVDTAKETYLAETRFNGQTIVLRGLLNDLFDADQRRIYIITITDFLPQNYIHLKSEAVTPLYIYGGAEPQQDVWLYQAAQYSNIGGFKVMVPIALAGEEAKIIATVNKYKLAGKPAFIEYY